MAKLYLLQVVFKSESNANFTQWLWNVGNCQILPLRVCMVACLVKDARITDEGEPGLTYLLVSKVLLPIQKNLQRHWVDFEVLEIVPEDQAITQSIHLHWIFFQFFVLAGIKHRAYSKQSNNIKAVFVTTFLYENLENFINYFLIKNIHFGHS